MDFLLRCPRGPDHQGRHAVPEAESAADGPPWAAGAEKDRTRGKSVTRLHRQRGKIVSDQSQTESGGAGRSFERMQEANISERAFRRMQIVGNWLCALCGAE